MPDYNIEENGSLVDIQPSKNTQSLSVTDKDNINNCWKFIYTLKKPGIVALKLTNFTYCALVSIIFGSLSAKNSDELALKIPYALSSGALNFAMSWVFALEFKNWCSRVISKIKNKDIAYLPIFLAGFAATGITAVSMIKPAQDAINGSDNDLVKMLAYKNIGVGVMEFNTISTRIVSSMDILERITMPLFSWLYSRICKEHIPGISAFKKPLDGLNLAKKDLDNVLKNLSIKNTTSKKIKGIDQTSVATAFHSFYSFTQEKGISIDDKNNTPLYTSIAQKSLLSLFYVTGIYLCIATAPAWLNMTEKGFNALQTWNQDKNHTTKATWGNNAPLVWGGTIPNIFLCIYLTTLVIPIISRVAKRSIVATSSIRKGIALVIPYLLFVATIGIFSGAGMSFEARDGQINGFGNVANRTYFGNPVINSLTSFVYPILPMILMVVCGAYVNAPSGAELLFKGVEFILEKFLGSSHANEIETAIKQDSNSIDITDKQNSNDANIIIEQSNNDTNITVEPANNSFDSANKSICARYDGEKMLCEYLRFGFFIDEKIKEYKNGSNDPFLNESEIEGIQSIRGRCTNKSRS